MNRVLKIAEPCALLLVPAGLSICAFLRVEHTALLSVLMVLIALVPFFLRFERQRPRPRDVMPVVVLAAIAAAGRVVFAAFPNVKPVTAIVIVAAVCFGRQTGFLTGALAALASNLFFGQGPWTPWQMYAWGLIGFAAGWIAEHGGLKSTLAACVFGFCSALFYGVVLDSWVALSGFFSSAESSIWAIYLAGLPHSLVHAVSTTAFLALIYRPWEKKLDRVKQKYGINDPQRGSVQ